MPSGSAESVPLLTIEELLKLALPPGTQVLAGKSGLSNPLRWVANLRITYPLLAELRPQYLAIGRLKQTLEQNPSLTAEALIREMAQGKASGLILDRPLGKVETRIASELGLPVILVEADTDLYALKRDILRALIDRERREPWETDLFRNRLQALLAAEGLYGIVPPTRRITRSPRVAKIL